MSTFQIDLSDLEIEDIEVLMQEGGRGMPEFAASTCKVCDCGTCSCTQEPTGPTLPTTGTEV